MTLATATADGRPSARIVLLKGFDQRGFVFFTNYESRKATELTENPHAAAVFYWPALDRQVRISGSVERVPPEGIRGLFSVWARLSRLGALGFCESRPLPDRRILEANLAQIEQRFPGEHIPLPPFWGGYRLIPDSIEFWQAQPNRLHDRLQYVRQGGGWIIQRLFP